MISLSSVGPSMLSDCVFTSRNKRNTKVLVKDSIVSVGSVSYIAHMKVIDYENLRKFFNLKSKLIIFQLVIQVLNI